MKILVAPDSFKGTLSSLEVSKIICKILSQNGFDFVSVPVGDGGEGTLDSILFGIDCEKKEIKVKDPLGREIDAYYGVQGEIAFVEAAQASGLNLLNKSELNPWIASTYGFGQLILDAVSNGSKKNYLGIGGTATNDLGIGMLQAFGVKFYNDAGKEISERKKEGYGPGVLQKIFSFDSRILKDLFCDVKFIVLCDVTNPLYGENGASFIYSPQKGASENMMYKLEDSLEYFGDVIYKQTKIYPDFPGAGAAGGLGAALKIFLNAEIISGIDGIIEILNIDKKIKDCDIVITGEGSMDHQSAFGKAPLGIAKLAKKFTKKVIAINGRTDDSASEFLGKEIDTIYSCFGNAKYDLKYLKLNAKNKLKEAAEKFCRDVINSADVNKKIIVL
jgi:glycerate kinase